MTKNKRDNEVRCPRLSRWVGVKITALCAAALASVSAPSAYALQGGEDPALLPVLIDKRYGMEGRHQLSLMASTSMVTKFVSSTGVVGAYQFNFSDIIGVELNGGFFLSDETNIMKVVRDTGFPGPEEPPLTDLYQLQWIAGIDLMIVPIYGKMSFASEIDPSFDLFLVLGGGVAGVQRQLGLSTGNDFDTKVAPVFNFGLGFRFYFNRLIALRLELRDYFFPEQNSTLADGKKCATCFTWNLQVQGGLQFAFGGE